MTGGLQLVDDPALREGVDECLRGGRLRDAQAWRDCARKLLQRDGAARIRLVDNPEAHRVADLRRILRLLSEELGFLVPQTYRGNRVSSIRDAGANYSQHETRGHQTGAALGFHSDRTDLAALLYVRVAPHGGELSVVSYEDAARRVAARDTDAHAALFEPIPFDLRVERIFAEPLWTARPVFWHTPHGVRGHYIRRFITDSQRHPSSPRLTASQVEALDLLDEVLSEAAPAHTFAPSPGEIVLLDQYRVMHARTAFHDEARGTGRLVLRTWIAPYDSSPLPDFLLPLAGSVVPGAFRGGVGRSKRYHAQLGSVRG